MLYNTFKYTLEFHFLLIAMQKIIARVRQRREALGFFFSFLFLFQTRSVFTSHLSFLTLTTTQRHFCHKNSTAKLKKVNEPVPFVLSLMYCKILCKILSQQDRLTITYESTPRKIESTVFNFIINEQVPKSI